MRNLLNTFKVRLWVLIIFALITGSLHSMEDIHKQTKKSETHSCEYLFNPVVGNASHPLETGFEHEEYIEASELKIMQRQFELGTLAALCKENERREAILKELLNKKKSE